jgi:hypothetical protein
VHRYLRRQKIVEAYSGVAESLELQRRWNLVRVFAMLPLDETRVKTL